MPSMSFAIQTPVSERPIPTVVGDVLARLAVFVIAVALSGCGLFPEAKDETADMSAERLYKFAHDTLLEGNYNKAIKLYETLESRFPYGRYAQQSILESAYANYRAGETAAA